MLQLKPFSQNLVFFDTEFSSLDPYRGELLSFGAIDMRGNELYLEIAHDGHVDEWTQEHVVPKLILEKVTRQDAVKIITDFIGPIKPTAVAFVDNYDNLYTTKLFTQPKLPFEWLTIDFASILFALGYDPLTFLPDRPGSKDFYAKLGIDPNQFEYHHALGDAKLLREVWMKFFSQA